MTTHLVVDSPVGPLTLVADGDALCGLYMSDQAHLPDTDRFGPADDGSSAVLASAAAQLEEYFAGERTDFDLPLRMAGTDFQRRVWSALQEVPYGVTASYGDIARSIGRPTAFRAVGLANGRNPVSIVVPCHRVVGASGDLTGYGGGVERKQLLLDLERRFAGTTLAV